MPDSVPEAAPEPALGPVQDAPPPSAAPLPALLPDFTPVPRQCERHDGWTPARQRAFIEALADTGSVRAAVNTVGQTTVGAYRLRRQPGAQSFAAAWSAALDLGVQRIEDVAMDRALNGVEVPVYSYGKLVGTRIVHNDRLVMFMLRNRAPERFCEGRPKGLSAIDRTTLNRMKAQWRAQLRAEWEQEREQQAQAQAHAALKGQDAGGAESFDARVARIRQSIAEMEAESARALSPATAALKQVYEDALAAEQAAGYRWWADPDHPDYTRTDLQTHGRHAGAGPATPQPTTHIPDQQREAMLDAMAESRRHKRQPRPSSYALKDWPGR